MSTDKILSSKADGVGILTFNNPERRNAVSPEMSQAAAEVLEDFTNDKAVRVIVLTGAGDKAFVSGRRHLEVRSRPRHAGAARGMGPEVAPASASCCAASASRLSPRSAAIASAAAWASP